MQLQLQRIEITARTFFTLDFRFIMSVSLQICYKFFNYSKNELYPLDLRRHGYAFGNTQSVLKKLLENKKKLFLKKKNNNKSYIQV